MCSALLPVGCIFLRQQIVPIPLSSAFEMIASLCSVTACGVWAIRLMATMSNEVFFKLVDILVIASLIDLIGK